MNKEVTYLNVIFYILIAFMVVMVSADQLYAGIIEFSLDKEYSGGSEPEGIMPWAIATFIDSGPNTVSLIMSADNLEGTEFISVWLFNFDPALNPNLLSFSVVGTPGVVPNSINTGIDAFKAGPDKFYDIEFDFPPPNGNHATKFTAGKTVVYDISYNGSGTINAYSFYYASTSDVRHGAYHSAVHMQGIGNDGKSGWIGNSTVVPEPISSFLFVAGGAALGFRLHLRKRRSVR